MSVKNLNERIAAYKKVFVSGEIQTTYQALVGIIQKLRTNFVKQYQGEYHIASIQHGYIDVTYFYLQNDFLKNRKLKLAIVLNHPEARFELWLLGQTKAVQTQYWQQLKNTQWINNDVIPEHYIFQIPIDSQPDFDNLDTLFNTMHKKFSAMTEEIYNTL